VIILRIFLEMRGQFVDLARGHRDLHLGRARVRLVFLILPDDTGLYSFRKHYLLWYINMRKLARVEKKIATPEGMAIGSTLCFFGRVISRRRRRSGRQRQPDPNDQSVSGNADAQHKGIPSPSSKKLYLPLHAPNLVMIFI
jgi:hypothetical protein